MYDITIKVYEIAKDGYPDINRVENDIDYLCSLGFVSGGILYSGYPEFDEHKFTGCWIDDNDNDHYYYVTHWFEFPGKMHELFPGTTLCLETSC